MAGLGVNTSMFYLGYNFPLASSLPFETAERGRGPGFNSPRVHFWWLNVSVGWFFFSAAHSGGVGPGSWQRKTNELPNP